jgi:hypothetical protein
MIYGQPSVIPSEPVFFPYGILEDNVGRERNLLYSAESLVDTSKGSRLNALEEQALRFSMSQLCVMATRTIACSE